jgi:hypothetical protein
LLDDDDDEEELRLRFLGLGEVSREDVSCEVNRNSMNSGSWNVHKSSTDAGVGFMILMSGDWLKSVRHEFVETIGADEGVDS